MEKAANDASAAAAAMPPPAPRPPERGAAARADFMSPKRPRVAARQPGQAMVRERRSAIAVQEFALGAGLSPVAPTATAIESIGATSEYDEKSSVVLATGAFGSAIKVKLQNEQRELFFGDLYATVRAPPARRGDRRPAADGAVARFYTDPVSADRDAAAGAVVARATLDATGAPAWRRAGEADAGEERPRLIVTALTLDSPAWTEPTTVFSATFARVGNLAERWTCILRLLLRESRRLHPDLVDEHMSLALFIDDLARLNATGDGLGSRPEMLARARELLMGQHGALLGPDVTAEHSIKVVRAPAASHGAGAHGLVRRNTVVLKYMRAGSIDPANEADSAWAGLTADVLAEGVVGAHAIHRATTSYDRAHMGRLSESMLAARLANLGALGQPGGATVQAIAFRMELAVSDLTKAVKNLWRLAGRTPAERGQSGEPTVHVAAATALWGPAEAWVVVRKSVGERHEIVAQTLMRLVHDAVAGLAYLHENGIAHMDVKPQNYLVLRNERLLDVRASEGLRAALADYGLARLRGTAVEKKAVVTVTFKDPHLYAMEVGDAGLAPKIAATAKELRENGLYWMTDDRAFAADAWALGATIFDMLYEEFPMITDDGFAPCRRALPPLLEASYSFQKTPPGQEAVLLAALVDDTTALERNGASPRAGTAPGRLVDALERSNDYRTYFRQQNKADFKEYVAWRNHVLANAPHVIPRESDFSGTAEAYSRGNLEVLQRIIDGLMEWDHRRRMRPAEALALLRRSPWWLAMDAGERAERETDAPGSLGAARAPLHAAVEAEAGAGPVDAAGALGRSPGLREFIQVAATTSAVFTGAFRLAARQASAHFERLRAGTSDGVEPEMRLAATCAAALISFKIARMAELMEKLEGEEDERIEAMEKVAPISCFKYCDEFLSTMAERASADLRAAPPVDSAGAVPRAPAISSQSHIYLIRTKVLQMERALLDACKWRLT